MGFGLILRDVHSNWLVRLTIILCLTILVPTVLFSASVVSLLHASSDTLLLSLQFEEPSFVKPSSQAPKNQGKIFLSDVFKSLLITSQSVSIDVEVVAKKVITEKTDNPVFLVDDVPIGIKNEYEALSRDNSESIIEKRFLGQVDGKQIFQLKIHPYNNFQWIGELKLKVMGKGIKIVSDVKKRFRILSSISQNKKTFPQVPSSISYRKISPDNSFPGLKILVDHEGIFLLPQQVGTFLHWILDFLELSELLERFPSELSERKTVRLTLMMLLNSGVNLSGIGAALTESVSISLPQKMYTGLSWERNQV